MNEHDDPIVRLVELAGVLPGFRDQNGQWVETPLEARRAIAEGFGYGSATPDETRDSIGRLEAVREALIPALIPAVAETPSLVPIRFHGHDHAEWLLTAEDGTVREGRSPVGDGHVLLPPLGTGYLTLSLRCGDRRAEATIISAPPRCYLPEDLTAGGRLWGAVAQVYGLRNGHDMGIGDYSDVAEAARGTGLIGGDFLGLSPLHALFEADRTKYSPYSPSSRLFLESLHIDITAVPGFAGSRAAELLASAEFAARLEAVRGASLIDHEAVWALKRPLLDLLYSDFMLRGRDEAFETFRSHGGEPLERHATFDALSEHFRAEGRAWMGEWPREFRDPKSDVVAWFRDEKADRVTFYAWLQFLADSQLGAAARKAREAGMAIGLYRDLAVGGDRGGSEVWAAPELFSPTLSVGAPPDPLGPQGQNWGLPPMDPIALEQHGLKAFRALVSANMRHAGAIRIDHAFQLRRLFLIPEGGQAADGAYVSFPFEALLAALRLESHRARCVVIAEDLGTAPEGFSDAIMQAGLLSYRVMYFERGEHGRFKHPRDYPRDAMAVFTTHDLPTLRGWWHGLDIELRENLGIFDHERARNEQAGRAHDRRMLCQALREEGIADLHEPPHEPPLDAAVRFISRAPSGLAAVQFEDVAGEMEQANLPGVAEGHPNWRRRLPMAVDELTSPDGRLAHWSDLMRDEGRGRGTKSQ